MRRARAPLTAMPWAMAALVTLGCARGPAGWPAPGPRAVALAPTAPARASRPPAPRPATRLALGHGATLRIGQQGRWLPIRRGDVRLRPAPFVLELQIPVGGPAVYLNAALYPTLAMQVLSGMSLARALPVAARCYALGARNPTCPFPGPSSNRELFLSEEAYSCWLPHARHPVLGRSPRVPGAGLPTCRYPVDRLRDLSGGRNASQGPAVSFASLRGQPLFLVFGTEPRVTAGGSPGSSTAPLRATVLRLFFEP